MISQLFLLLIVVFYSSASGVNFSKQSRKCTEIMSNYDASSDLVELVSQVERFKMAVDDNNDMNTMDAAIANDLNKCQQISKPNFLAKFMVDDMNGKFIMTSKIYSCKSKLAEMEHQNANTTNRIAQMDGQIVKLKEMIQQFEKEHQQMRNNSDQALIEMAKKMDEQQQQMNEKLVQQFEKEQQQMRACGQEKAALANAKNNWKIATFVLIGGGALLILTISVGVWLFTRRHLKAQIANPRI